MDGRGMDAWMEVDEVEGKGERVEVDEVEVERGVEELDRRHRLWRCQLTEEAGKYCGGGSTGRGRLAQK